jgi:5-deoxy-D-glucuronate isomerase
MSVERLAEMITGQMASTASPASVISVLFDQGDILSLPRHQHDRRMPFHVFFKAS